MAGKKGISTSGTGYQTQEVSVGKRAITRIAPNEAQGTAGCDVGGSAEAAAHFQQMVEWSAPGLGSDCCGFGDGFKKPGP